MKANNSISEYGCKLVTGSSEIGTWLELWAYEIVNGTSRYLLQEELYILMNEILNEGSNG